MRPDKEEGGLFLALAVAERLDRPLLPASVFPFTPTRAFPAPLVPPGLSRLGGGFNRASHVRSERPSMTPGARPARAGF